MSVREQLALYGCDESLPARLSLRAGPVSLELVGGRFGPVRVNGHEVWHGLAFLFRDAGWGTPEPVFEQVHHRADGDSFLLELNGHIPCDSLDVAGAPVDGARILLDIRVQGDVDGRLSFLARAEPTHALLSNRCGWVLMHPMSAAGHAVEIQHVDGRVSQSTLPKEVPAWPPFTGVSGLRHEYAPGHWAHAQLPGEDYELEDQRNNADASFKTYSRSNCMPRPYVLRQHQPWTREVHLCLQSAPPPAPTSVHAPVTLRLREDASSLMRLGLAITPEMTRNPAAWMLALMADWRPAFLQLTLWPETSMDAVDWSGVRALLQAADATLRLDLCGREGLGQAGADDAVCHALAQQLAFAGVVPAAVAALPCGVTAANFLREVFPHAVIGGGTPHFFAQLNRLELRGGEDFMSFTLCPIVHGADDEAVMNGLQSLPSMLATARSRHPGRQWHIGPSALSARASPLGRQPKTDGQRRMPLASCDPRSRGLFGAAWLLGHLAVASRADVQALTLPPLVGEDGLWHMAGKMHQMTPSAAMLQICMRWSGIEEVLLQTANGSVPERQTWAAIAGRTAQGRQILLANLSADAQQVHWPDGGQWQCLDAQSWIKHQDAFKCSPWQALGACPVHLVLPPYALAWIDLPFSTGD